MGLTLSSLGAQRIIRIHLGTKTIYSWFSLSHLGYRCLGGVKCITSRALSFHWLVQLLVSPLNPAATQTLFASWKVNSGLLLSTGDFLNWDTGPRTGTLPLVLWLLHTSSFLLDISDWGLGNRPSSPPPPLARQGGLLTRRHRNSLLTSVGT